MKHSITTKAHMVLGHKTSSQVRCKKFIIKANQECKTFLMGGFGGRLELLMVGLLSACCWRCRSAGADLTLSAGADLALPVGVSCRQSLTRSHSISISSSVGVLSSRMSVILVGLVDEAVRYIMQGTWYHHICCEVFSYLAFCCGMPCLDSKMEGIAGSLLWNMWVMCHDRTMFNHIPQK